MQSHLLFSIFLVLVSLSGLLAEDDDQNAVAPPASGGAGKEVTFHPFSNGANTTTTEAEETEPTEDPDLEQDQDSGPTIFAVTSSDIGFTWDKLPYREKYMWKNSDAPCHPFVLQVPGDKAEQEELVICIYRPQLECISEAQQYLENLQSIETVTNEEPRELKVFGHVHGQKGSSVYGKIIGTYFYGEVSLFDDETGADVVYVVEEINLLNKLMRFNEKVLRNIFSVMNRGNMSHSSGRKYNAVVTRGSSLMSFMVSVNPSEYVKGSFLVFTTSRNSYITAGEPQMEMDPEAGKITFNAGGDKIVIDTEGPAAVHLITSGDREYTFHPHGKTIVQDGTAVRVLEEHEGSVAVSAFTSSSSYGCVLPTPAFNHKRKGGYLCKVCLSADKLFKKHYVLKLSSPTPQPQTTIGLLSKMVDQVSWMFRSTDWNNDGHPDNVGLDYDPQIIISNTLSEDEELDMDQLDTLFVSLAEMDFSDCCVVLSYTMKMFPGPIFAKSSSSKRQQHNGACAVETEGRSNNVVLISGNSKEGNFSRMTEEQLTMLTGQMLAKSFGANMDGTGDDACDQFKAKDGSTKHFLMWPDVLRTFSKDELTFSNCSKLAITSTLDTCKSACFDVDKHPFCGNGVVEEGEECDCGSEMQCAQQKCCYDRMGLHPCMKTGIGCKKSFGVMTKSHFAVVQTFVFIALLPLLFY